MAVCYTSCGSDDEVTTPPVPETLPEPVYAAKAASFTLTESVVASNGATLKNVIFTEAGKAAFVIETADGSQKSAVYDVESVEGGTYTIKGVGTVTSSTTRSSASTTLNVTVTIVIDGVTYTFTTSDPVAARMAYDQVTGGNALDKIARSWTVQSLFLTLEGDVSLSKLEQSGNLEVFMLEARKRDAGLTKDEEEQLKKTVKGFTLDKAGNFIIEYAENADGSSYSEVCTWSWNGSRTDQFKMDMGTDMGNKFLSNSSIVNVEFNAAGGCTFSMNTEIKGSKNYRANLIVVLK